MASSVNGPPYLSLSLSPSLPLSSSLSLFLSLSLPPSLSYSLPYSLTANFSLSSSIPSPSLSLSLPPSLSPSYSRFLERCCRVNCIIAFSSFYLRYFLLPFSATLYAVPHLHFPLFFFHFSFLSFLSSALISSPLLLSFLAPHLQGQCFGPPSSPG